MDVKSVSSFVSSAGLTLEQHLWPASLKFGENLIYNNEDEFFP